MTFSHDTKLTVMLRLARSLALVTVLILPTSGTSALNTPQRPAVTAPTISTAVYNPGTNHYRGPHTYLAMIGPAALRFAEGQPSLPPEPILPTPIKPKLPQSSETPTSTSTLGPDATTKPATTGPDANSSETSAPNSPKPVSILPDDTRHEIRAEDVLPFFQFPGASDNSSTGSLMVPFTTSQPSAPTAPVSSATYRQQ